MLIVVAFDPNLMPEQLSNRLEFFAIGGAMLLAVDEIILLGISSFFDQCVIGSHETTSSR